MSTKPKTSGKKRPRQESSDKDMQESDYDSYSDDDSDSDDFSSDSEGVNTSKGARQASSQMRKRKLEPCYLDSLLWQDLDFHEYAKLFLKNDSDDEEEEENTPEQDAEEESEGSTEPSGLLHGIVIKTEPKSDNEEENENTNLQQGRRENMDYILPDVPVNSNFQNMVTIKTEPQEVVVAPKKAKTTPKPGTSQSKKNVSAAKRNIQWKVSQPSGIRGNQRKTPFSVKTGKILNTRNESLTFLFNLFFTPEVIDFIVTETNKNAATKNPSGWTDLTPAELSAFIAVNVAMGIDRRETLNSYWSTYPVLHSPWFGSVMSKKRFRDIHRFLTLDSGRKGPHVFYKVKKLQISLSTQFKKHGFPNRWLVIDEQVLGTKCKMSYLQKLGLPTRAVEWGLKVFTLSDALTGYVLSYYVYPGRAHDLKVHPHGVAYDIVMNLLRDYHGKGYVVFMDNFYTSAQLFLDLLEKRTLACGISRPDRKGFPEDLARCTLEPDMISYRVCGDLIAMKWESAEKQAYCMSTYFGNLTVKKSNAGSMPEMLSAYNTYMGKVDLWDQPMCYFSLIRKPIVWWRKVFWRLVDLTLNNMVALRRSNGLQLTNASLRKQFVVEIVNQYWAATNASPYEPVQTGNGQQIIPVSHLSIKAEKRSDCVSCSKAKVKNFCTGCQKYICTDCYETYHVNVIEPEGVQYALVMS